MNFCMTALSIEAKVFCGHLVCEFYICEVPLGAQKAHIFSFSQRMGWRKGRLEL